MIMMFDNYSMIGTYMYLDFLFGSLTLSLIITKYGFETIRKAVKEWLEQQKNLK